MILFFVKIYITLSSFKIIYKNLMNNSRPKALTQKHFNQTFQSSVIQTDNDKFLYDKSLIQGIKQQNVTKIIGNTEETAADNQFANYDEKVQIAMSAISIRNQFNQEKNKTSKVKSNIEKIKGQIAQLQITHNQLARTKNWKEKNFSNVKEKFKDNFETLDSLTYRKDVYTEIINRDKSDLLILKKRYFDLEVDSRKLKSKLRSLRGKEQQNKMMDTNCKRMLGSVQKTVFQQQRSRNTKINSFCDVLAKRQDNVFKKTIREIQLEEVVAATMSQKSKQQVEWEKILRANIFFKMLLKAKMNRVMDQYGEIQKCFQKIKMETGVHHADQFIVKFMNKQSTYGELLDSISDKQAKLGNLKNTREQLQINNKHLELEADQYHISQNIKSPQDIQQISKMEELKNKLSNIEKQKQKMYQWSIKLLTILKNLSDRSQMRQSFPRNNLKQAFNNALKNVNEYLDKLNKDQNSGDKINQAFLQTKIKGDLFNEKTIGRNVRVKTLYDIENQQNEGQAEFDQAEQMDYFNHMRRAVKRKFRIKTKPY